MVLWVALVNRTHALGINRHWMHLLTLACIFMFAVMPIAVGAASIYANRPEPSLLATLLYAAAGTYVIACAVVCIVGAVQRLYWRFHGERKSVVTSNHTTRINLAKQCNDPLLCSGPIAWLGRLPGNQVLDLSVQEKQLTIPRLGREHYGLRIAHLTDLHMSGRMTRPFYEHVVEETNRREPDIIAITGDIADSNDCLDWIPEVLGRLDAPGGVFYVLGNHDKRVNQDKLRAALAATNWTHVGTDLTRVTIREFDALIGGNELPWYGPPSDFSVIPDHDSTGFPLRIVLSHSPDQIGWANTSDVDLMLAGHVHGGQICLPVLGPFTAPSMHGVRYAAGTFCVGKTVLHVSRGAASLTPLRWGCPPEIAVLSLGGVNRA